jgi:hypothetical protein
LYARDWLDYLTWAFIHVHLKRSCMLDWLTAWWTNTLATFPHDIIIFTLIQSTFPRHLCSQAGKLSKMFFSIEWVACFVHRCEAVQAIGGPTSTFPCYHALLLCLYNFSLSLLLLYFPCDSHNRRHWLQKMTPQPKGPSSTPSLVGSPPLLPKFPSFT